MTSKEQQALAWGDSRIVCKICGIPLPKGLFPANGKAVCLRCQEHPVTTIPERVEFDAARSLKNHLSTKMQEALKNADPQLANGVPKAIEILGETPQEVAAKCIKQIMSPTDDDGCPMPAEVRKALRVDYKTIRAFAQMLQDAQVALDKQLQSQNPFEGMTADDLRAVIMQGTLDHVQDDAQLRKQLIHAFMERVPTFVDEVVEVAQERGVIETQEVSAV